MVASKVQDCFWWLFVPWPWWEFCLVAAGYFSGDGCGDWLQEESFGLDACMVQPGGFLVHYVWWRFSAAYFVPLVLLR